MLPQLRSLPLAIRLPLLAGLAVFVSSVGTTHLALSFMQRELDSSVAHMADVYIDSLAGTALPWLRAGDFSGLEAALERSMGFQRGVNDLAIIVADPSGRPLAHAGEPQGPSPMAFGQAGLHWSPDPAQDTAWVQRELVMDGQVVALVAAQLAFPEQTSRQRHVTWVLTVADLVLATLAAGLAMLLARRLMQPFLAVRAALNRAGTGDFEPLPLARHDVEANRLAEAFNLMAARLREREELASRLAERERAAMLGRLAASVAHEVRNPLAGMLTALETARRFGDDPAARGRALDLVERGLRQIEAVVRSTLATYRQNDERRPLSAEDLEDLRLLVMPEARRGQVGLDWHVSLPEPFPTDALRLRQLLLNLLLNAVAATPPGRQVRLRVDRATDTRLTICVEDEAGGLPAEAEQRLAGSGTDAAGGTSGGLGLEIAAQLAASLGARIGVVKLARGSRITLDLPARAEKMP
ncbi:ATP-binding protein [Roseomonas marmotae]|uniref:histidine kinase n=1 Tax=Roseomonas marmotae TaxID=2768161 RepID=A0ABS3K833_9PROT|nr:HAMP domain-containing sensor histidine kinase [Roseomonas marmotae]MBO1073631.1 HAMP domain-containing histidine kinase [Roseomonas marmotae]MBO1073661.1 HAMP domain-containing histidine kinase [Roseomonas marmotae]QTI80191.1 HAMP domain-containing histidine kinase [Roseomonas marmotae]